MGAVPVLSWINLHRILALGVGAAVLIAAVAAGAWYFILGSPDDPARPPPGAPRMPDSESGTSPYWLSASTGLVLRQRESVDVSQSSGPMGSVHYEEHMSIKLTSVDKLRCAEGRVAAEQRVTPPRRLGRSVATRRR